MAIPKETGLRVISRGYDLRMDKQKQDREKVSIDRIAEDTGLAKMTVRRFVAEADADISGSPLLAAAVIAEYFNVPLGDLVTVEKEAAA